MNNYKILISGNYNAFNEGWNGCGVYMCSGNYKSETFKRPIYIGSSINLQSRIENDHISELRRNKHCHNDPLQYSWNKHKEENFIWYLLENCEKDQTFDVEQKYLDLYRPFVDEFGGFNIAKYSNNPLKDRKRSDKSKLKQSLTTKGIARPWSRETGLKYGGHNKGISCPEEIKQKISQAKIGKPSSSSTKIQKGSKGPIAKRVICIENGIIYNSMVEAAKAIKTTKGCISRACINMNRTVNGLHWKYFE